MASIPQMLLQLQPVVTAATVPVMGYGNGYNATSGALGPALPALASVNPGVYCLLQKTDSSANAVTFTCAGADTFDDASTTLVLSQQGQFAVIQKVNVYNTSTYYWKVMGIGVTQTYVGVLVTTTAVQTLTGKRVTKRVGNVTSTATPTFSTDSYDAYKITALAVAITGWTITGTPVDRDEFTLLIKDNGSSQNLMWPATFKPSGVASLPQCTSAGKTMTFKFVYDSVAAAWILMAADINGY